MSRFDWSDSTAQRWVRYAGLPIAGVIAVVAAGAVGVSLASHKDAGPTGSDPSTSITFSTAAPTSSTSVPGAGGPTALPRQSEPTSTSVSVPAPPKPAKDAAARVNAFVKALVSTKGMPRDAWTSRVTAFATPDYKLQLALTDPADIPDQKVTGKPQLLMQARQEAVATYFVPTSREGYTVTVLLGSPARVMDVHPGRDKPAASTPIDQN